MLEMGFCCFVVLSHCTKITSTDLICISILHIVPKRESLVLKANGDKCPESVPRITLNGNELKQIYQFKYL